MPNEKKEINVITGHMTKPEQEKHMRKIIENKRFQVTVEILGKRKYAYCDDLKELDPFMKAMKGRIIEVVELNKPGN